ncbi:MAG TPA: LacI family DNA-binding transcriptional regulator [Chryseosolibacter sp.]
MEEQKDITIYDIAKKLALSPATVSRGLKDHPAIKKETRKRIKDAAAKMGYQNNLFASNLRSKKTNTIGLIVPKLNSYFMSSVISGMEQVANARGYNLIISQSLEAYEKEISSANTMFNSRVDGLLVSLAYNTENLDHFEALLRKKIPVIFFDRVVEHPRCTNIVIDNTRAGYEVAHHLLEQGCKRMVFLGGNLKRNVYADRLKGYKLALAESGIAFDESLVIINGLNEQGGQEAAQQILQMKNKPDGLFACNDSSAVACMQELKAAGLRVPTDIAVAGFNNEPSSRIIEPNLTTVNYPGYEMGEIAATTLLNAISSAPGSTINTLLLRHQLIVRESSLRK